MGNLLDWKSCEGVQALLFENLSGSQIDCFCQMIGSLVREKIGSSDCFRKRSTIPQSIIGKNLYREVWKQGKLDK